VPVVWHVAVLPNVERGTDGLEGGITARGVGVIRGNNGFVVGGLRPPTPSSVAPSGIPTRPTDGTEPIPVGEEANAAGPAKEELLPSVGQVFTTTNFQLGRSGPHHPECTREGNKQNPDNVAASIFPVRRRVGVVTTGHLAHIVQWPTL
jgi:hypothetical protein